MAHLTFAAELFHDVISRGVQGDTSPPANFPGIDLADRSSADAYLAQTAIARRKSLGEQLLPTFKVGFDQLHHLLASLSAREWEQPCWRFRWSGPIPARSFLVLTLQELAIHGWDIRSRIEPSTSLSAESLSVLVERAAQQFCTRPRLANFHVGTRRPAPVRYRFAMRGEVPSMYDFIVEEAKARLEPAGSAAADLTFHCDTETFVLMMSQRLTPNEAVAAGRLSVEGESELLSAFDQWLKGT